MEKTKKKYVRLNEEQRAEIYQMYKDGLNQNELADMFNVSQRTVSSIVKEQSIKQDGFAYDRTHVGSRIAKTINPSLAVNEAKKTADSPQKIENQNEVSSVVTERTVTVTGLGTGFTYTVSTESDEIMIRNHDHSMIFSIKIEKLEDFILELGGVARNAANIKIGTEAW